MTKITRGNEPVILAGARTPFLDSAGAYHELMSHELAALAVHGLIERSGFDAERIEHVVMGTVLHEVETTNVARETMLSAGLNPRIPAHTVAMAGLSPNVGITSLCDQIALGRIQVGLAGGVDNFSDVPVRLSRNLRKSFMQLRQRKSTRERLSVLAGLRPWDFGLDIPKSSDFTTGLTMGDACETMGHDAGIAREASDSFAARSHELACKAWDNGVYDDQVVPVRMPSGVEVSRDNTPRHDTTTERLAKLKPVFDRAHGQITPGNASRFSDGAGVLLLSSRASAERMGREPLAIVRDYVYTGVDSLEREMLLGPAMAIPRLLQRHGLTTDDIDVWEIHEAFALQVLINLRYIADNRFVSERFGFKQSPGPIPMEKLNIWGGSLGLGNPFAATGTRLFLSAAQRLQHFGQRYAVISTCAGGGLGAAILLENPNF